MYIIGHRGAAGIAPENTLRGLAAAKKNNVDAVECDVRITKDNKLIVFHDATVYRLFGQSKVVKDLTLAELRKLKSVSKQQIPTLSEYFEAAGTTPLVIEGKGSSWAKHLAAALKKHKGPKPMVMSYNHGELFLFKQQCPGAEVYAVEDNRALEVMRLAKNLQFDGVSLGFWLYNPLTYLRAKQLKLKLIVSPLNKTWTAAIFHFLYPKVKITTDYPNLFKKRKK